MAFCPGSDIQYLSSVLSISSGVMGLRSIAFHAYTIYAMTKGMMNDTHVMTLSVNWLEQLLAMVRELCRSVEEG